MDNVVKAEELSIFPPTAYDMGTLPRTVPQVLQLKYNFYLNTPVFPLISLLTQIHNQRSIWILYSSY